MPPVFSAIWSENDPNRFFVVRLRCSLRRFAIVRPKKGREVLLVTSSNGRWILPKGWPIDGMTASEAAQQEAWEEGGVKADNASADPIDTLQSTKDLRFRSDDPV